LGTDLQQLGYVVCKHKGQLRSTLKNGGGKKEDFISSDISSGGGSFYKMAEGLELEQMGGFSCKGGL